MDHCGRRKRERVVCVCVTVRTSVEAEDRGDYLGHYSFPIKTVFVLREKNGST